MMPSSEKDPGRLVASRSGDQDKIDSRNAFLEASLYCFATKGFDATSLRDIAQRAHRNTSLISHYFGCKEGLYVEVFRYIFRVRMKSAFDDSAAPYTPPRERREAIVRLRELIHLLSSECALGCEPRDLTLDLGRKLFFQEMREPRPQVMAILKEHVAPWVRTIGDCLRILKPELSEAQRAILGISIMGEMTSHILMRSINGECWGAHAMAPFQAAEMITEFNLRGLGVYDCPKDARWLPV